MIIMDGKTPLSFDDLNKECHAFLIFGHATITKQPVTTLIKTTEEALSLTGITNKTPKMSGMCCNEDFYLKKSKLRINNHPVITSSVGVGSKEKYKDQVPDNNQINGKSMNAGEEDFEDDYLDTLDEVARWNSLQAVGFARVMQTVWDSAIANACESCSGCEQVTVKLLCANDQDAANRLLRQRFSHASHLKDKSAFTGENGLLGKNGEVPTCGKSVIVKCK